MRPDEFLLALGVAIIVFMGVLVAGPLVVFAILTLNPLAWFAASLSLLSFFMAISFFREDGIPGQ